MKKIRHSKFGKLTAFVLALLITQGLYSCKKDNTLETNNKLSNLSGEDIFKGIFFLQGEFPKEVNYLSKKLEISNGLVLDKKVSVAKDKIINEVVAEINRVNPKYFSDLKKTLYSKNYDELNESIKAGGDLLAVGLVKSNTMKRIMPQYQRVASELDLGSYDFEDKTDTKRFMSDVAAIPATDMMDDYYEAMVFAGVIAIVAAAVAVTVAVVVSWVVAGQVGAYALVALKVKVVGEAGSPQVIDSFDSQLLTKDMMHAL